MGRILRFAQNDRTSEEPGPTLVGWKLTWDRALTRRLDGLFGIAIAIVGVLSVVLTGVGVALVVVAFVA